MCCCLVQSCCCGWQTLEHGLFIFAVFDIFWNLVMVCFSILVSNAGIAGLNGLLILTDVGLAFGAKQGVIRPDNKALKGIVQPFELGGESSLMGSVLTNWRPSMFFYT
jgi:hypothetical protein